MSYDSWKTSPPEPDFGTCQRCGESEEDHELRTPSIFTVLYCRRSVELVEQLQAAEPWRYDYPEVDSWADEQWTLLDDAGYEFEDDRE